VASDYQQTENNIGMYFDLDAWDGSIQPVPSLHIVKATTADTLRDFALVLTNDRNAFQTYFSWVATVLTPEDPIEYYVGYVDGKPVVRGLSCYFAQVVGLHWLSTAPNERHKGYGRAMQQFRLQQAKERGFHVAVLQAEPDAYPLYKKLGYSECGVFKEFKLKSV
jgi:GNAT superfamily N-acetyltransferase